MKLLTTILLLLFALPQKPVERPREFRYSVRIYGRYYPTDSIWSDNRKTFWIGADGITYGLNSKKIK